MILLFFIPQLLKVSRPYVSVHEKGLQINAHAVISSAARGLNFCLSRHLHSYFVYASNKGSGKSVHLPEPLLLDNVIITKNL